MVIDLATRCKEAAVSRQISASRRLAIIAGSLLTFLVVPMLSGCGSLSRTPGDNLLTQNVPPRPTLEAEAAPATAPEGVMLAGYSAASNYDASPVVPASCQNGCCNGTCSSPYGSEACGGGCGQFCSSCGTTCGPLSAPYRNAQEYIFDGGDQNPRVVVKKDWSAVGVDPTDTVAYYETDGGQLCVKPTNRVPIYAPRFGAVRKVTGVELSARAVGTERVLAPVRLGGFEDLGVASNVVLPVAPVGEAQVALLDAFQENNAGVPVEHVLPLYRMSEARVPFEALNFFRTGELQDKNIAVIGRILAGARTWYNPESIGILIDGQDVAIARDTKAAEEFFVYDTPDKCSLRICKAASHTIAASGDVVSFTIRFDNIGVKPIKNTVIMDSLSPRLEYIEGSQQSSVDTLFSASDNEVGSSLLRWELSSQMEPSTGGVISFDCRVR